MKFGSVCSGINAVVTGATANQASACGLRIAGKVMPAKGLFLRITKYDKTS